MQISHTATTLAVVFELFSMQQEKLIEIGLHCVHTNLVFSEAFKKPNSVISGYYSNTATSKAVHRPIFVRKYVVARRGLAT